MDLTGEPDGPPQKPGVAHADLFTGLYGIVGVLAALRLRDRTGQGQWIDLSLFDTQLAVLANQAANYLTGGVVPRRMGNAHPNITPYQVFEAADAPLVVACGNDGQFVRLCEALGLDLHRDPRFAANRDRLAHRGALVAALGARVAAMPRAEVLAAMEAAGVPAGPINTVAEAFAEPQAVARGMVQEIAGSRSPRSPLRFSAAETAAELPPPRLDEHGAAIRAALAARRRLAVRREAARLPRCGMRAGTGLWPISALGRVPPRAQRIDERDQPLSGGGQIVLDAKRIAIELGPLDDARILELA